MTCFRDRYHLTFLVCLFTSMGVWIRSCGMQLSKHSKDEMQVRMRVELQLLGQPAVRGISALCHSPSAGCYPFPGASLLAPHSLLGWLLLLLCLHLKASSKRRSQRVLCWGKEVLSRTGKGHRAKTRLRGQATLRWAQKIYYTTLQPTREGRNKAQRETGTH